MSVLTALQAGIKVANKVTRPLQALVTYERETGTGAYGPTFAAPVKLHMLVDYKAVQVRTMSGELSATRATLTTVDIAEVIAATAGHGFGNNDKFTLPDGDTGPTLDLTGFIDPGTGIPLATTVMMG